MMTFLTYNLFLLTWVLTLLAISRRWKPATWMRFAWLAGPFVSLIAFWVPEVEISALAVIELPEISTTMSLGETTSSFDWTYLYVLVSAVFLIISVRRVVQVIQLKQKSTLADTQSDFHYLPHAYQQGGPFSFFQWIFIPRGLSEEMMSCVLEHERVHVRRLHSWDVLFVEILTAICWFNPAVYLMKRGLSISHELEADQITSEVLGERFYVNALLSTSFGMTKVLPIVQPFSKATIKTRIIMLNNKKSPRFTWVVPLALAGMFVTVQACTKKQQSENEIIEIVETPTKQAEFPGGMQAMMTHVMENLKYPEDAKESGLDGMVAVKFQIGIDGKVSNATIAKSLSESCDAAAIEAVESMPDWTPAMNEGQPVATELTLPIRFQLD